MTQTTVMRRYTFKLYPKPAQAARLLRQTALLNSLWNAALSQREVQWAHECQRHGKGERKGLSRFDQQRELKIIRAADPEFAAMSSASLELTIKALDLAFKAFFRRAKQGAGKASGYPKYKSADAERFAVRVLRAGSIPHRDGSGWKMRRCGKHWRFYFKGAFSSPNRRGEGSIRRMDGTVERW